MHRGVRCAASQLRGAGILHERVCGRGKTMPAKGIPENCRRAERSLVALDQREPLSDVGRQYLNRLSDYFFMLARILNKEAGRQDVFWQKEKTA